MNELDTKITQLNEKMKKEFKENKKKFNRIL